MYINVQFLSVRQTWQSWEFYSAECHLSLLCFSAFLKVLLSYSQSVRRLWKFPSPLGLPFPRRISFVLLSSLFSEHLLWWLFWQELGEIKPKGTQEMMSYDLFYTCLAATDITPLQWALRWGCFFELRLDHVGCLNHMSYYIMVNSYKLS